MPIATAATATATIGAPYKLDDNAAPDDNTDLNASTTKHGLLPKLDNDATHFLNGQGAWVVPTGTPVAGVSTPTRSAEVNLDATATMAECQYLRVGNTVFMSGRFTVDPTTPATPTSFEFTLPVASNIGVVEDLAGTATCGATNECASISGSVANNTAVVEWTPVSVASQVFTFTLGYQVI